MSDISPSGVTVSSYTSPWLNGHIIELKRLSQRLKPLCFIQGSTESRIMDSADSEILKIMSWKVSH